MIVPQAIQNIQLLYSQATGAVSLVELRIRIIAEYDVSVQDYLRKIIEKRNKKNSRNAYNKITEKIPVLHDASHKLLENFFNEEVKIRNAKFWNCDLELLIEAVLKVFSDKFSDAQIAKINRLRACRNNLIHGNFVALMKKLDIEPQRMLKNPHNARKNLFNREILEAVNIISNNGGLNKIESLANDVSSILDEKILQTYKTHVLLGKFKK